MNIKRWFRNWLNKDDYPIGTCAPANAVVRESDVQSDQRMTFEVLKATGGYVISTRSYDRKLDRSYSKLHIIRDDEEFNDAIGRIITMESMAL